MNKIGTNPRFLYFFHNSILQYFYLLSIVCLLVTNPTFTGCIIKARPIGILYTFDNAGEDPKIIAVPTSDVDPRWDEIHHIDDLGHHMKEELFTIFKQIKFLEHEKYDKVDVKGFGSVLEAQQEILSSIERYNESLKKGN